MDNCHSGTGTRMLPIELDRKIRMMSVDVRTHSERDRVRSSSLGSDEFLSSLVRAPNISTATSLVWNRENYEQILASREIVLPRFLVPPFEFQERLLTNARKKALRTQRVRSGSNLLLAACRDNQTAADAYIEGDFHGAFTYYLCKTLRQFPRIESRQLIETVARTLRENQFIQEPQHEGDNLPGPIFSRHEPVPSSNGVWERPPSLPEASGKLDRENQKLLIEAYLKLLDTIARRGEPIEGSFARAEENRHLVYVHGITQHRSGYSNSWWRALQQHIGQIFGDGHLQSTRWEVLWSDLVNPRALANDEIHREGLRLQIEAVLEERQRREIIDRTSNNQEVRQAIEQVRTLERGRGFAIDDFLSYMLDSKIRKQIIDRFIEVVEPLLSSGKQIDIISHSWGTVVAYEGLRELERNRSRPGRISNFFTVGSALSIGPARAHLKRENKDGIRPFYVDRWINIDAKGDLVGGMLADMFDVTEEYLDLIPTDCSQKLFGYSLVCAHSSYFDENNTTVNRDIFAKLMSSRSIAVGE